MEKVHIDRRIAQMQAEGVSFRPNSHIGTDISAQKILADYDAVVLAVGSEKPRDLDVEGRNDYQGVYFAMDFLRQQNKRNAGDTIAEDVAITATDKHVVVIGGGRHRFRLYRHIDTSRRRLRGAARNHAATA